MIRDGRVQSPVTRLVKLGLDEGVEVVGGRFKVATKGGLGLVKNNRHVKTAVVASQQRLVVAENFGQQTEAKEKHK